MPDPVTENTIKPECGSLMCRFKEAVTNVLSSTDADKKLEAVNAIDRGSTVDTIRNTTQRRMEAAGL